jgi:hypothetical protein
MICVLVPDKPLTSPRARGRLRETVMSADYQVFRLRPGRARVGRDWCKAPYNSPAMAALFARGGRTESPLCSGTKQSLLHALCELAEPSGARETRLTVSKLIVLADIYNLPTEQLLRSIYPEDQHLVPKQLSSPNATMLLTGGWLEEQAAYLLPDTLGRDQPPDETGLLAVHDELSPTSYRRGIIGKRDPTLAPMIPAGSIVQIDIQKRAISSRKDWTHEFQRPIYFLMAREGYVCGWCELDKNSEWLTLVPHPLSPASSRRWKYRMEVENMGRVVDVAIRFAE